MKIDQPPGGATRPSLGVGFLALSSSIFLYRAASSSSRFFTSGGGSFCFVPTVISLPESQPVKHIGMLAKHKANKNLVRIVFLKFREMGFHPKQNGSAKLFNCLGLYLSLQPFLDMPVKHT
jgi:hypothetical protein